MRQENAYRESSSRVANTADKNSEWQHDGSPYDTHAGESRSCRRQDDCPSYSSIRYLLAIARALPASDGKLSCLYVRVKNDRQASDLARACCRCAIPEDLNLIHSFSRPARLIDLDSKCQFETTAPRHKRDTDSQC